MSLAQLEEIRGRLLPMLRVVAEEYRQRVPAGYPVVVDMTVGGALGIELDPSHALYLVSDGERVFADLYYRSARDDARTSASREKFGGVPFDDRRPIAVPPSDQDLRNLLAELMSHWNFQPGIIHITDS